MGNNRAVSQLQTLKKLHLESFDFMQEHVWYRLMINISDDNFVDNANEEEA